MLVGYKPKENRHTLREELGTRVKTGRTARHRQTEPQRRNMAMSM
jgi:hypothetical protein